LWLRRFWGWNGAGLAGQERGDDLEVVEHPGGAGGVEIVGGYAAEELRGDEEGRYAVLDDGEGEGLGSVEVAVFAGGGFGAAGGVVVVAEALVAEGGRAAAVAVGEDVAAAEAAGGVGGDDIGLRGYGLVHGAPCT
jgi:hypothetical protein